MDEEIYIHYGHKHFDETRFEPIQNRICFNKPSGGLWASPTNAERGWRDWCEDNDFRECNDMNAFKFTLSPTAKVFHIHTCEQAKMLKQNKDNPIVNPRWVYIDFEEAIKQYDAIELHLSDNFELYWLLYGWDCDSIIIMNPDIVVEI